jgi:hypothetical protein
VSSQPCRELVDHDVTTMMARCCGGSVGDKIGIPNLWVVCVYVVMRMMPMGVVPLLGGIIQVCQHFPAPASFGVCLRPKALVRSRSDSGDIFDVIPLLGALHLETCLIVYCCAPLVLIAFQG